MWCVWTSTSGPKKWCFYRSVLEICFAPKRRAQLNISTSTEVLCAFLLANVVRAITACNFSSLIYADGSAPVALTSLYTFRPSGATKHWKNTVFRIFSTFFRAPASSFFWLFLFSDFLSSLLFSSLVFFLLFSSLLFSVSSSLCFFSCPYCRKFDF